jgi:hypothetical protein
MQTLNYVPLKCVCYLYTTRFCFQQSYVLPTGYIYVIVRFSEVAPNISHAANVSHVQMYVLNIKRSLRSEREHFV